CGVAMGIEHGSRGWHGYEPESPMVLWIKSEPGNPRFETNSKQAIQSKNDQHVWNPTRVGNVRGLFCGVRRFATSRWADFRLAAGGGWRYSSAPLSKLTSLVQIESRPDTAAGAARMRPGCGADAEISRMKFAR